MNLPNVKFKDVLRHPVVTTNCDYIKDLSNCLVLLKSHLCSRDGRLTELGFSCRKIGRKTCWVGLNLHGHLDIKINQQQPLEVNAREAVEEMDPTPKFWRDHFLNSYPKVFSRLERSKNHRVFTNFKDPLIHRHVNGRKIPFET